MPDPTFVRRAFAEIAPRYVLANHVLSMGIDLVWRRAAARLVAGRGPRRILDVATGSGDLAVSVSAACPEAEVAGVDFCAPMLALAKRRGLLALVVGDGMRLPIADDSFDAVTIGFGLRNMADYPAALREFARVIRPGGFLVVLDFSLPAGLLRRPYRFYLNSVLPRAAGLLTGSRQAYEYLCTSIEAFPSGDSMCRMLEANGFAGARWIPLTGGIASLYIADRVAGAA